MNKREFVIFESDGTEVDWIDPFVNLDIVNDDRSTGGELDGWVETEDGCEHKVTIPKGRYYEIREIRSA